jgi:hypothetical protein
VPGGSESGQISMSLDMAVARCAASWQPCRTRSLRDHVGQGYEAAWLWFASLVRTSSDQARPGPGARPRLRLVVAALAAAVEYLTGTHNDLVAFTAMSAGSSVRRE